MLVFTRASAQVKSSTGATVEYAPRLDQTGTADFQKALQEYSNKYSTAFVVEGVPLHKFALDNQALPSVTDTPQPLVEFATQYDYEIIKSGNVFVFRKRYTEPDDVPLVTLGECQLSIRDAIAFLSRFFQIPPRGVYIGPVTSLSKSHEKLREDVLTSLSNKQWQDMTRPGGLPLIELGEAQQRQIVRYATDSNVHIVLKNVLGTERQLDSLKVRKPALCYRRADTALGKLFKEVEGKELFGYEFLSGPRGWNNLPEFRPQSSPNWVISNATTVVSFVLEDEYDKTKMANFGKDETEPSAQDFAFADLAKRSPAVSLSAAVDDLNRRTYPKAVKAAIPPFAVDDAYAAKPVLIIGEEKVKPKEIFQSLAFVYGLRIVKDDKGAERLARSRPVPPKTMQDVPAALVATLPLPLQKVLGSQRKTEKFAYESGLKFERDSDTLFHIEAVKQLRAMTETRIKAAKDGKVAVADLEPEVSRDLAIALITTDYLRTLRAFQTHRFPAYLNDVSHAALSGSRTAQPDGSVMYRLNVCEIKADGSLSPRLSASNFVPAVSSTKPTK